MVTRWTGALTGVGPNSGSHQALGTVTTSHKPQQSCPQGTVTSLGTQAMLIPAGTRVGEGEDPTRSRARPGSLPRRGCTGPRVMQVPRRAGQSPGSGQLCSLPAPLASLDGGGFTVFLS